MDTRSIIRRKDATSWVVRIRVLRAVGWGAYRAAW